VTPTVLVGDVLVQLAGMPSESVQCVVTSPPYWGLRDYGHPGQIGLEPTVGDYVGKMVSVFREVRRVLRSDGTLWLNLGDAYANDGKWGGETGGKQAYLGDTDRQRCGREKRTTGLKPKNLIGIPWRVAFALQADGWYLRQDIIWHKPNPMPESVLDRCTKAHEYVFLMSKSERYFYDAAAISEPAARPDGGGNLVPYRVDGEREGDNANLGGSLHKIGPRDMRNKRSVWTITSEPYPEAHFATFPTELARLCILAGTRLGDVVLDPFAGSGTTLKVALELGRQAIGIELNPAYAALIDRRTRTTPGLPLEMA
jgi:DNA modification methylase